MLLQVYLRPYKLEEYEALVKPLGLWPFPRGHQRHLTSLPIRGATVLLADQRSCPLLPDSLRIRAHPRLQPSAAQRGVDCNAACKYVSNALLSATATPAPNLATAAVWLLHLLWLYSDEPGSCMLPALSIPHAFSASLLHASVHFSEAACAMYRERGMECSQQDFWFLNSCEVLRQHFPCERGCTVELGQDIPNYVVDPELATHQTCLIAQKQPACGASHPATARLCPCIGAA